MVGTDYQVQRKRRGSKLPVGVDLHKLCESIRRDRQDLAPFRANRTESVRQLVGLHYSNDGSPVDVPVNLLGLYYQIMMRALVSDNPRVMYSTFDRDQGPVVAAMESWANDEIADMQVVETYKRVIGDALFWRGQVKIALADPVDAALDSWGLRAGQPFMELIDPDDAFEDQTARRFDQCSYAGHYYRLPVHLANDLYGRGRDDEFTASDRHDLNYEGDERIETIGRGTGQREEFEDHCDLCEVHLARHKVVVTLRMSGGIPDCTREPVRVQPWIGPPCGPYHTLSFLNVPGNLQPKGPVMDLIDLHRNYNSAYRKLLRQTSNYKKVLPYRGGNAEETKRLKDEPDGGMFQCDNADTIKEIETGGPANAVLVMSDHMKQMFDFIGGNLAMLGGREAQSRTATQDKMLNENASAGVVGMQEQVMGFVQKTMESMNWFWWNHPTKEMRTKYTLPSDPSVWIQRKVGPAGSGLPLARNGEMPKMKIDGYSLSRQTPQSRLAFINQVIQAVQPMLGLFQQQGVAIDANALLDIFAKYGNEPDLQKIFHYVQPPEQDSSTGGGQPDQPGMPSNTKRTYERISSGQNSPAAQANDLSQNIDRMEGPANPNQG